MVGVSQGMQFLTRLTCKWKFNPYGTNPLVNEFQIHSQMDSNQIYLIVIYVGIHKAHPQYMGVW